MARRVSFAPTTTTTTTNRLPVADDAWGNNEYLAADPSAPPPPVAAAPAAAPRPPPPPPPLHVHVHTHQQRFPTLRALCLSTLAQHLFLLADVAASEDPDVLRRALPCADDRLALAAAARRRGELSSTALFTALADPTWPVLSIGSQQPSAQAVTEAAQRGLLKGVRRVEWVLPSEVAAMVVATPTTTTTTVLLPSEAASVVRNLAAHCDALEELVLRRADPTRPTRPAVAAAVAKAVLAAALPKGLLPVSRRRKPGEEDEEEEEPETKQQAEAAPDSWEDALAPADQDQAPNTKTAVITFAPSFRLLRWEDLPDATSDAIRERCPRIALDRQRRTATTKPITDLDAPWLSLLAPKWDDRAALLQEKREEERAKREAARGKGLPVVVPSDDEGEDDDAYEQDDATAAKRGPLNNKDDDDSSEEDDSLAARFRRAYVERAQRLKQVERAKEAQRRRREVRASPALRVVERWLDEPV